MMCDAGLQRDHIEAHCKESEENNRTVFGQVVTDLEHLGSDLADRERMKAEGLEAVLGEYDYEPSEFTSHDEDEELPRRPALPRFHLSRG